MLFHFSKPSLVIIYDLETNHDCLCLGYFPVDLFNHKCHFTSVSPARISPLSALLDQNARGCAAPQSSQACANIHLCIAYTLGFMSWGKCTCPSALGHMFSDWFAHRGAAGALKDKCLPRALWPPSLWNQAKTSFHVKPQQTPATMVFHLRCDAKMQILRLALLFPLRLLAGSLIPAEKKDLLLMNGKPWVASGWGVALFPVVP